MDNNATIYRSDGSGVLFVGDMEVIPGIKVGFKSFLAEKVECEIGLWYKLFQMVVSKR